MSGDFERVKKIIEEKDRDMKSLQKEFEKLLSERNSQIAAEVISCSVSYVTPAYISIAMFERLNGAM